MRHLRAGVADGTGSTEADLELDTVLLTAAIDGLCIQWLLDPSIDIARLRAAYRNAPPGPDQPAGRPGSSSAVRGAGVGGGRKPA